MLVRHPGSGSTGPPPNRTPALRRGPLRRGGSRVRMGARPLPQRRPTRAYRARLPTGSRQITGTGQPPSERLHNTVRPPRGQCSVRCRSLVRLRAAGAIASGATSPAIAPTRASPLACPWERPRRTMLGLGTAERSCSLQEAGSMVSKRWSQLAGGGRRPDQSPRAVKMARPPLWLSRHPSAAAAPDAEWASRYPLGTSRMKLSSSRRGQ